MPYEKLGDVVRSDGQRAEVAMVRGPSPEWMGRLCAFLNSPPRPEGPSFHHFLLENEVAGLESRYYFMLREGQIVGCIFTTDSASVGYINSTFVLREERRLGTAAVLMDALEEDFTKRGGDVRFFTTRTGSPAEDLFAKFGYRAVYERGGRTGMEQHYGSHVWEDYFDVDPRDLVVENIAWSHWVPHRALMWNRPTALQRPLGGDFLSRIREALGLGRTVWKGLTTPDGRLMGDAVLRSNDSWGHTPHEEEYMLDIYVHPGFEGALEPLFDAVLPSSGRVQTFLDRSWEEATRFVVAHGFALESSLLDDFNHHDPSTPDTLLFARAL